MDTKSIPKLKKLEAIFSKSPEQVKDLANSLYTKKGKNNTLTEMFAKSNLERYQMHIIVNTMKAAMNAHVSLTNQLLFDLYDIDNM